MEKTGSLYREGYIDSHQHFWRYHPLKHSWITDEMAVIRKDFLPGDLYPLLQENNVTGCVAVQADRTETETDFLLDLAGENSFIKGVVGWIDLTGDHVGERLEHYRQYNSVKGFREILQGEEPEFMLRPAFLQGIQLLGSFGFTYDILIFPQHLPAAVQLVKQFPDQRFVIDHLAKPYIKAGAIDQWRKDIGIIAQYPNVHCKISGMVTEADILHWKPEDMYPYLDAVLEAFSIKRVMYGSDWPVCLVAASYAQTIGLVTTYFSAFSTAEQSLFFHTNARHFYQL